MDSARPTAECIAGEYLIATGEDTFDGNNMGKADKSDWLEWSMRSYRSHRQPPYGYGHPS